MAKEDAVGHPDNSLFDITTAVEELHTYSAQEMKKLLRDSQCLTFRLSSGKGASVNVDVEKVAAILPLHLLACVASNISQPRFRYLLRGIRLLHSLSILATRYPKLEQILLQEVKIREQVIDLVIFTLIVLADVEPDGRWGSFLAVLHSALVACCLYLLTAFVTPDWRDVAPVLLAHPKVEIFMDAAFDAVRRDIGLLQGRFRALSAKLAKEKVTTQCGGEQVSSTTLQQCEASLQVLQALCEPQAFRDRLLTHKELCNNGGILLLVLAVVQLQLPVHLQHLHSLNASISRLKSKVLAMLLKFCETETVSFLDEVAADTRSLHVAKLVAGEIIVLVRGAFFETFTPALTQDEIESGPMGALYMNAMRLADVLSDDSNFRNLFMDNIAPDLATILAMDPHDFCSKWCGGSSAQDMAESETDAVLVYDPYHGSGAAMLSFKASASSSSEHTKTGCSLTIRRAEPSSYVQELSALLVKLFANLHCFNPEVCPADEKDRFLCLFMQCLTVGPLSPSSSSFFMTTDQTAVRVCENLHILVDHVASLSPDLANDEDVQLASVFAAELHENFCLSPDSRLEAPVIAYVREAHEQRLRGIISRRELSERWQRLLRQDKSGEMEQTNVECGAHPAATLAAESLHNGPPEEASSAIDSKASIGIDDKPNAAVPESSATLKAGLVEEECVSKGVETKSSVLQRHLSGSDTLSKAEEPVAPAAPIQEHAGPSVAVELHTTNSGFEAYRQQHVDLQPPPQEIDFMKVGDAAEADVERKPRGSHDARTVRKSEEEPQPRKRQRRIMSEQQIAMMESALKDEPEMQRYPDLVQHWTTTLNQIGPEITPSQLKNWINNRKAKLAKLAKEGRAEFASPSDRGHRTTRPHEEPDTEAGGSRHYAYPKQPTPSSRPEPKAPDPLLHNRVGQRVVLKDEISREVAMGIIQAITPGEKGTGDVCLVKVLELKVDRGTKIPIGSDSLGTTFDEAEKKLGSMIVAWRFNNLEIVENRAT